MMRCLAGLALLFAGLTCALPARAAPPPLAAYGKLPALEMVRLSPSGDKIAFVAVDGEERKLFVRQVGGDALVVSPIGKGKVRNLQWAGDDYVLITASATAKFGDGIQTHWGHETRAELLVMLIVNLKTKSIRPMFDQPNNDIFFGAIDADYGSRLIDGQWYEFVNAYTMQPIQGDVYKVNLETRKYKALTTTTGDEFDYLIGADGQVVAHSRYNEFTKSWAAYTGDRQELKDQQILSRPSALATIGLIGLGRDSRSMLVADRENETDTLDEYPLSPHATPTRLFPDMHLGETLSDPATGVLLGGVAEDGQTAVFFSPKLQRRFDAARKAFAAYQITLETYSTDLAKMVVKTDGADDPGTFWLIDMTTGKAEDLMSAYPGIDQKDVGPTRMFAYTAADGLAVEGVLTLPPGSSGKNLPLVMMPHGGPLGVHDRVGFDWWAQAFASRGYAVFQPNYRGSGGYGVPFEQKGMGEWGRGMLTDMSDGMAALAKAGIIDPARACIVGASYGGYAALAGVTVQHGLYRCAVSYAGVSDPGHIMEQQGYSNETAGGRYTQKMFGATEPYGATMRRISPLKHAAEADAPILLIHGKDDTRAPIVNSLSMKGALELAHKPVEMLTLTGEDHFLSRETTRVQTLEASVAFVEKYNPPAPPSAR